MGSKLEDKSSWEHASQQARVAWYTLFDKYMGWKDVGGTPYHVVKHGHLMSGAPLIKLKARIVEHNIRMMAKYYTKIRLARMAKLLALTEAQTEDCLSEMVVAGTVSAKTDRLEGIIDFT